MPRAARTTVLDVAEVLRLQVRADAQQAAGTNIWLSRPEQRTAEPHVQQVADTLRSEGGPGTRVSVAAVEERLVQQALALINAVNQPSGSGHTSLSQREAKSAFARDGVVGLTVLRAYEVASGNGLDVDAIASTHVNKDIDPDAVFMAFATEAEAAAFVHPDGKHVWWLVALQDGLLTKSYVSGRNDLWSQRFNVDRLTGLLTVTQEH